MGRIWHKSTHTRVAIALLVLCAAACAKRNNALDADCVAHRCAATQHWEAESCRCVKNAVDDSAQDAGAAEHAADADAATAGSDAGDAGQPRESDAAVDAGTTSSDAGSSMRSGGGGLGTWRSTADWPLTAHSCAGTMPNGYCARQTCVASAGYVYCIGGAGKSTYYSELTSAGMGPWTSGTDYPVAIQDASCVISSNYIYCVGGRVGEALAGATASADVYYAPLSSAGIGNWTATSPFPQIGYAQCMTDSGHIYCVSSKAEPPYERVAYYAALSSSGVGEWTATAAPPGRTQGCVSIGGSAYCFGGSGCAPHPPGSDCYSHAYYAPLTARGIGPWKATTELPTAVSANYAAAGSYIYYLSNPIFFARVSTDGIGPWETTTGYPKLLYPSDCFSSGTHLYCAHPTAHGSYFAPIGVPRAIQLENPPPFPRSEYLGRAWNDVGAGSVTANGVFAGAPQYYQSLEEAAVFDCASRAATAEGCATTVVSPGNTAYNYDLTIWSPCKSQTPANANCCYVPAVGYPDPFFGWCSSIGSNSFIIAQQIKLQPGQ